MPNFQSYWTQNFAAESCPFVTRNFSQRIGALVAFLAERFQLTPNMLSLSGLPFSASACLSFLLLDGVAAPLIACAFFQLAYGIDCADGQLARATDQQSAFGAWLDIAVDHARNVMITITMMSFLIVNDLPVWIASLVAVVYGIGVTVSLHAFGNIKASGKVMANTASAYGGVKTLVKAFTDTPVTLAIICALSFFPLLLATYLLLIGVLSLLIAILLANTRIRLKQPETA